MTKKQRQKLSVIIKNNVFMIRKIARYTPEFFLFMLLDGIFSGIIQSAYSIFTYRLLNTVENGSDFLYAVKIIAVISLAYFLFFIFNRWYRCVKNPLIRQKLHLRMHEELFVKARELDLSCFDDPEFYNDFVWAMNESDARAAEVLEDTGTLIKIIISSFTLLGLMVNIDWIIAVILFLSSCVTVACNLIGGRISFYHGKEITGLWRVNRYINRIYHLADYAKEIRISHVGDILTKEYDENNKKIADTDAKFGKKYFFAYALGWNFIGTVTFFSIILYMISKLEGGALTVGGFAAAVTVIWDIRWMLTNLIECLTRYAKHSLFIEKYLEFLRFEPRIKGGTAELPEFVSLELRDVSFSYEFSSHPKYLYHDQDYEAPVLDGGGGDALRHVSLTVNAGDKIAVVGYNGAGKTTLIKLIMRLYDPTDGVILYNGVDIREYDVEAYRRKIGTVFQDYKIFAASIAENVMNGRFEESDGERVRSALASADFTGKLNTLEDGIKTHLTREFNDDGTNLSGGEAQKIAISRVFAKDSPIVIMDEPSSALDPVAEYTLNQSIMHNTEGKTVIFISHRLSTTRIADRIFMFDAGRLIEEGSHDELVAKGGKYSEMFRVQSEKYKMKV